MPQLVSPARLMGPRGPHIGGSSPVTGTHYYVSASGSDSNNGTSTGTPWQTVSKVNASSFNPGDTVSFNGGDTFTGPLTIPSSGSSGAPITFNSYGTGQATITAPSGSNGIESTDQTYITVDSLTVTGVGAAGSAGDGIFLQSTNTICTNLIVQNCNVSGMPRIGILILAGANVGSSLVNPQVLNCISSGNTLGFNGSSAGIYVGGQRGTQLAGSNYNCTGVVVRNCYSINNSGKVGTASHCGSGIILNHVNGGLVEYCYADNNGGNCTASSGPGGIWGGFLANITFQYNVVSNQKTGSGGTDGGGFDFDGGCNDCICQYNITYRCVGFGYLMYQYSDAGFSGNVNNIYRYNISYNDGFNNSVANEGGGFRLVGGGYTTSGKIYGNTVFVSGTNAIPMKVQSGGSTMSFTVANNNLTSNKTGTTDLVYAPTITPSGMTFAGNNYYTPNTSRWTWGGSTYATLALWRGTGQETTGGTSGVTVAPLYLGFAPYQYNSANATPSTVYNAEPYRPDEASPVLGAGVNLSSNFSITPGPDFYGSTMVTGSLDIGHAGIRSAYKTVVLTGSGNQTIPADLAQLGWVDCEGAGGGTNGSSAGSGGGAFARILSTTTTLTPGVTTIAYSCGAAGNAGNGGDTWWNASSLANAQSLGSAVACAAEGGKTNSGTTGGAGGAAANSVGTVKWSGGAGGNGGASFTSGGGGAGGPNGVGGAGSNGGGAGTGAGGGGGGNGGRAGFPGAANIGGQGGTGPFSDAGGTGSITNGSAGTRASGGGGAGNNGGVGGAGSAGVDWRDSASGTFYGPGSAGGGGAGAGAASETGGAFGGGSGGRHNALGGAGGIRFVYKTSASV